LGSRGTAEQIWIKTSVRTINEVGMDAILEQEGIEPSQVLASFPSKNQNLYLRGLRASMESTFLNDLVIFLCCDQRKGRCIGTFKEDSFRNAFL
jgi:hypothetical protein